MKAQNLELKKYILQFGLLLAGTYVIFELMLFSLEMHSQDIIIINTIRRFITFIVVAFALYHYREDNKGELSVALAVQLGLGMITINTVFRVAYFLVLTNFLDPELKEIPESLISIGILGVASLLSGFLVVVFTSLVFSKSRTE